MKIKSKVLVALLAATATFSVSVFAAGSKSNLDIDNVIQGAGTAGAGNVTLDMKIGNAKAGGESNVKIKNVIQGGASSGKGNVDLQMAVGNSDKGGKANVKIGNIVQGGISGDGNVTQKMSLGNAE